MTVNAFVDHRVAYKTNLCPDLYGQSGLNGYLPHSTPGLSDYWPVDDQDKEESVHHTFSSSVDWQEISSHVHVVSLNLSYNNLKTIPSSLFSKSCFSGLKSLELSNNQLSSLPSDIVELKNLKILKIDHNNFDHKVFSIILGAKTLNVLDLSFNQISQMQEVGPLSCQFEDLDLSGNCISLFPNAILACKKLKRLSLAVNSISIIPDAIGDLTNLESLNLSGNPIGELPLNIQHLERLKKLKLGATKLSELPWQLPTGIVSLDISSSVSCISSSIMPLVHLRKLTCDLMKHAYSEKEPFPLEITRLTRLEVISAKYSNLASIPDYLAQLPSLKKLHLEGNCLEKVPTFPHSVKVILS